MKMNFHVLSRPYLESKERSEVGRNQPGLDSAWPWSCSLRSVRMTHITCDGDLHYTEFHPWRALGYGCREQLWREKLVQPSVFQAHLHLRKRGQRKKAPVHWARRGPGEEPRVLNGPWCPLLSLCLLNCCWAVTPPMSLGRGPHICELCSPLAAGGAKGQYHVRKNISVVEAAESVMFCYGSLPVTRMGPHRHRGRTGLSPGPWSPRYESHTHPTGVTSKHIYIRDHPGPQLVSSQLWWGRGGGGREMGYYRGLYLFINLFI